MSVVIRRAFIHVSQLEQDLVQKGEGEVAKVIREDRAAPISTSTLAHASDPA